MLNTGFFRPSIGLLALFGLIALIVVPQCIHGTGRHLGDRPHTRQRIADADADPPKTTFQQGMELLVRVLNVQSQIDVKSVAFLPLANGHAGGGASAVVPHHQLQHQPQQYLQGTITCIQNNSPALAQPARYEFSCDVKAYMNKFDPNGEYGLMLSAKENGEDLVKVDVFHPSEVGKCQTANADGTGEKLSEKGKMAKEEENCVKTIDVERDELEKIGPITKAEAKRKIREIQNANLGNVNGSSSSSKKRKAAEVVMNPYEMEPYSVTDHTLWNDGPNKKYRLLTRFRHFVMRNVTAGPWPNLQYKFCASMSPYYAPNAIVPIGCVEGVPPTAGTPSQVHEASTDVIVGPAPALPDPPQPFTDMTVCTPTPEATQSLCTTVSFLPSGHAKVCGEVYLDDGKSAGDQSIACIEVKGCAVSGDGCPK